MPTGTPYTIKCPKCCLGKWGKERAKEGCWPTGITENRIARSAHKGHGKGGSAFIGFRGEVECRDCGHKWFSTHHSSGRLTFCECVDFAGSCFRGKWTAKASCKKCRGTGKLTEKERWT